jgi:hypothetical protein
LLRVPLVRHALSDRQVRWTARAVDRRWVYEGIAPVSVVGFNPFRRRVFYGATSRLAGFLRAPAASSRLLNAGDFLVSELLFGVHDYLHAWSYLAIAALAPELGLGTAPITTGNLEDLAFAHIVTEAAATVGLDYWYLCTVDLNDVAPIGTRHRGGLTVSYHERDLAELRRFDPTLRVQEAPFFARLVATYCLGAFDGFGAADLDRSPLLLRWMKHELSYARVQRAGIRAWLAFLGGLDAGGDLARPLAHGARWKRRLVADLGALLWEKVKGDVLHVFPAGALDDRRAWRSAADAPLDYRFLDARLAPPVGDVVPETFRWLAWQMACAHALPSVDRRGLALLGAAIAQEDPDAVAFVLRGARPVKVAGAAVRDVYFPN